MNQEMIAALRELEREKGIAFETILEGLEEAMASAYKSWWKQQHPELDEETFGVRAKIDPETGDLRVWVQELERIEHEDEEGEITVETKVLSEQEVQVTDEFKGRIGAQTAKQVIFQKLRDAEREMTYEEFAGREGDVVTGIVQQSERRYTLLDLGKVEALLPQAEQVPSEPYRNGERLKAYITEVRKGTQGAADRRVADAPRAAQEAVRARGARDRRGHRRDQGGGPRARPPFEDRGLVERAGGRPRRRVRRPEGLAGAQRGHRAPRREDRRGAVERRPGDVRRQRAAAGEGRGGSRSTPRPRPRSSSCPTTSSRSRSARRGRTRASRPGSPAGGSTSRARRSSPTSSAAGLGRRRPRRGAAEPLHREPAPSGRRARPAPTPQPPRASADRAEPGAPRATTGLRPPTEPSDGRGRPDEEA